MCINIKILRCYRVFFGVLACLAGSARTQGEEAASASKSPKPELLVSFSHSAIREDDKVPVSIWVSNESDVSLTALNLWISSPATLEWHDVSCDGSLLPDPVQLGGLAAHSVTTRTICLKSKPVVELGSINILFTLRFGWQSNGQPRESFTASEKPLTVALLGTDTLGGVPLGIAALVAPGLLFWLVLSAFGATWGPGIALGDKTVYSVLASALILILLSPFPYFDTRTGLSVWKLVYLASFGAGLGLVAGVTDSLVRRARQHNLEAQTVRLGDDDKTALSKLLRLYKKKSIAKTTVRLKDGKQYVGALGEQRTDLVTLVGWFRVNTDGKDAKLVAQLQVLATKEKYVQLFDYVLKNKLSFEPDAIKTLRAGDGQLITTGDSVRFWDPQEVEEVVPVLGPPKPPPIVVQ